MIDRRLFLGALASAAATRGLAAPKQDPATQREIRTITYNVLALRGYPRTDDNEPYLRRAREQMPERMAMELALYEPDLVTFQESPSRELVARVAAALGFGIANLRMEHHHRVARNETLLEAALELEREPGSILESRITHRVAHLLVVLERHLGDRSDIVAPRRLERVVWVISVRTGGSIPRVEVDVYAHHARADHAGGLMIERVEARPSTLVVLRGLHPNEEE